ncbi:conserved hypothetical protein, partial [Formosa agariphila KMM 3901]
VFLSSFVFAQTDFSTESYYKTYDTLSQNINLINGKEYLDTYRSLKKENHKFYNSDIFLKGSIVYSEQPYYGVEFKYDILNDLIIVELINEKVSYVSLNSELVAEFTLAGDKFIHLPNHEVLERYYRNGYFKESFKGTNYTLFTKYIKDKNEVIDQLKVYYTFNSKENYFLQKDDTYYQINNIKDLTSIFNSQKKLIQSFYKENKNLYRINREQFFKTILFTLDNINA